MFLLTMSDQTPHPYKTTGKITVKRSNMYVKISKIEKIAL